jgi:hypothetical protein
MTVILMLLTDVHSQTCKSTWKPPQYVVGRFLQSATRQQTMRTTPKTFDCSRFLREVSPPRRQIKFHVQQSILRVWVDARKMIHGHWPSCCWRHGIRTHHRCNWFNCRQTNVIKTGRQTNATDSNFPNGANSLRSNSRLHAGPTTKRQDCQCGPQCVPHRTVRFNGHQ